MKIIHFHPDAQMAARFIEPLMDLERRAGYRTELVSAVRRLEHKCTVIPFDLSASNLVALPLTFWRVRSYLKERCPDVVFGHNTKSAILPLLVAWYMRVPIRVYFNHGVPYKAYRGILCWLLRLLERWNMASATHVVTVSQDMMTLLQDLSPNTKIQIIQHGSASGIDLEVFSSGRYSRANWRKTLGLNDEDLVVVYVGRPERRKGFELVLGLWSDHFQKTDINLVMCGPDEDDVKKCLSEVPSNLIALGFVNNVAEVLASSDVLILPSLHEGLSYACMEAQASGTLVVANDIPGLRCLIENRITGILIADNSNEKYIEIIEQIFKHPSAFVHIREQAMQSIKKYSRKLFLPAYLTFLRDLWSKQGSVSLSKSDEQIL